MLLRKGDEKMIRTVNLGLIGFGNVGQELARIFIEHEGEWASRFSTLFKVVAIATRTKGSLTNRTGINLNRALTDLSQSGSFNDKNPDYNTLTPHDLTSLDYVDLVIEITTLDIKSGQPATDHIKSALQNGKDVITANKGPLAFHFSNLQALAEKTKRRFLFEGTVMDGTPVFNLVRETLPACKIRGFKGILNGTTNYILTEMAAGIEYDTALDKARSLGFVESDPSLDIDGWDAAAKVAVLMNVFLNANITPPEIKRTGISNISQQELRIAETEGNTIRLICEGYREGNIYQGKVAPVAIPISSPLALIQGTSSTLTLFTDMAGTITIESYDPQIRQTAYALITDLFTVMKNKP
jgi:homoserine dehydrogenase